MKNVIYTIKENVRIADGIYKTVLLGDTSDITAPGQFINIKLDGFYLRRPISVCDYDGQSITLIYKVVGRGTEIMSRMQAGEKLDVLTGLGNGFSLSAATERPLLVGGGVGVPPLYNLARKLKAAGKRVQVVLGFNRADEIFYADEFEALGIEVHIATVDGSVGVKGFVTDAMKALEFDYIYTCGPLPMLKAIYNASECDGEFSFEERMGCGFGACMGCSCQTTKGSKRICKEGPVLKRDEIIF